MTNIRQKGVQMSKAKVAATDARHISRRLKDFARRRYETWERFLNALGVARTTGEAWVDLQNPTAPGVWLLLVLARKANVNLNWLLLGEGPELRRKEETTPEGQLLAAIEAELRARTDASEDQHERVWKLMTKYSEHMLRLATEGVRPQYATWLRLVRQQQQARDFQTKWAPRFPGRPSELAEFVQEIAKTLGVHEPVPGPIRIVELL